MSTNKFRAAVLAATLIASVPLAMAAAGTAAGAAPHPSRPMQHVVVGPSDGVAASPCPGMLTARAKNAPSLRPATAPVPTRSYVSGLLFGGAGAYDPEVDGPPPLPTAPPSVPDTRSYVSGLLFGGAGAYDPEVDGPPPVPPAAAPVPAPRSYVSGLPFGGAGAYDPDVDCL